MNFAAALRRELAERALKYAQAEGLPHCLSYGIVPTVCFAPYERGSRHGNFLQGSYTAIRANPAWSRRLAKVQTQHRRSLPSTDRGRWMELDACTSSDGSADEHLLLSRCVTRLDVERGLTNAAAHSPRRA
jgi:hypothetical protein